LRPHFVQDIVVRQAVSPRAVGATGPAGALPAVAGSVRSISGCPASRAVIGSEPLRHIRRWYRCIVQTSARGAARLGASVVEVWASSICSHFGAGTPFALIIRHAARDGWSRTDVAAARNARTIAAFPCLAPVPSRPWN